MDEGVGLSGVVGDGCTMWFDRIGPADWRHCCDAHDLAYYELAPKLDADFALAACVFEAGGPIIGPVMAALMLAGLIAFGWIWYAKAQRERDARH